MRGQHAVERRRRAAALQVAQHDAARLAVQAALDLRRPPCCRCRPAAPGRFAGCSPCVTIPPSGRLAPSATTISVNRLPCCSRSRILWQTCSKVQGISGIRITSPPPAMPACRAIQPAWRPITSSTIDPLVAGGRGVQPVEGVGGAGHGAVEAERERRGRQVVVDRLGHADDRNAELVELLGDGQRAVAADADQAARDRAARPWSSRLRAVPARSRPDRRRRAVAANRPLFVEPRIVPPWVRMPVVFLLVERDVADRVDQPLVALEKADAVVAKLRGALDRRRGSRRSGPGNRRRWSGFLVSWWAWWASGLGVGTDSLNPSSPYLNSGIDRACGFAARPFHRFKSVR